MRFIFPIFLIAASVLIFILWINPFYGDVQSLKSDIDVYNTALTNSTELQNLQDRLIKSYNEISEADKKRLESFVPNSVDNIKLILEVERIAGLHSMSVKDVRFDVLKKKEKAAVSNVIVSAASVDTSKYSTFPLEFTTEGNYASFLSFLKDLEYNLRLVDIKSISFSVPEEKDKPIEAFDPNIYTYTLKVDTYWLK